MGIDPGVSHLGGEIVSHNTTDARHTILKFKYCTILKFKYCTILKFKYCTILKFKYCTILKFKYCTILKFKCCTILKFQGHEISIYFYEFHDISSVLIDTKISFYVLFYKRYHILNALSCLTSNFKIIGQGHNISIYFFESPISI